MGPVLQPPVEGLVLLCEIGLEVLQQFHQLVNLLDVLLVIFDLVFVHFGELFHLDQLAFIPREGGHAFVHFLIVLLRAG